MTAPGAAVPIVIPVSEGQQVSGLLQTPANPKAGMVLAHGAGAGMTHAFLAHVADGLFSRQIATLRYQFLYMEKKSGRPDSPPIAHAAVRAAVAQANKSIPNTAWFAGGKSFGGRMTSQAQAVSPLTKILGVVFLGFPLHPPGKPSVERAEHLFDVKIPMLFLQGDRDEFAQLHLLQSVTTKLGELATLKLFPAADHSFHVPAKSGRKDPEVREEMFDVIAKWMQGVISLKSPGSRSPIERI